MAESERANNKRIQVAVIFGHHAFDVPSFYRLLNSFLGMDFYPQTLANFSADHGQVRDWYDVLLFYHYHQAIPGSEDTLWSRREKETLERLGTLDQGIVLLHHSLVAFPGWLFWSDLCGITDRRFSAHRGQRIRIHNNCTDHPITCNLPDFDLMDETYAMQSPGEENQILLTVDHPNSMRAVAWTREYRHARVFCLQSGHDQNVYIHPSFRAILEKGLTWAARRL